MMPAHNGVKVFTPMLLFFNKFYKRKLFYVVIGGWLPKLLENKKVLANQLKRFDCIFVETNSMKVKLEQVGFNNIEVVPNCKELTILDDCSKDLWSSPFRFCVFSRVNRKKGIEDAVNVVRKLNEEANSHIATLDIYGNIDKGEEEWFASLQKSFDSSISYRGVVNFKESVDILKQYYALLFSTRYYTEGVPGTIIDAYAAGVPVISSKWESFSDVIEDGVTGFGYEFGNFEDLKVKIKQAIEQQSVWMGLKNNCLKRANDFTPKEAMKILFEKLEV